MKKSVLLLPLVAFMVTACNGPRGGGPQYGVGNFRKVDDRLYRGAQPDAAGLRRLKEEAGVRTVISLRTTPADCAAEEAAAKKEGLAWFHVPLRGVGSPADGQTKRVLDLIEASPGPVFLHCKHGCDRTGTMVACYRIQREGLTASEALRDAKSAGMSPWETSMRDYVYHFEKWRKPPAAVKS